MLLRTEAGKYLPCLSSILFQSLGKMVQSPESAGQESAEKAEEVAMVRLQLLDWSNFAVRLPPAQSLHQQSSARVFLVQRV